MKFSPISTQKEDGKIELEFIEQFFLEEKTPRLSQRCILHHF